MNIFTQNHGPLIVSSTYLGSEYEQSGKLLCSVNAGAVRILVPRHNRHVLNQWRSAKYAILSRGPWPEMGLAEAVEILWEDGSDNPYCLHLSPESFDPALPGEPPAGQGWIVTAWDCKKGKPHRALEKPCHWRRVPRIPYLKPLGE